MKKPWAERVARAVLWLYPPDFRDRYGSEIRASYVHMVELARSKGRGSAGLALVRGAADLITGALRERWNGKRTPGSVRPAPRGGREMVGSVWRDLVYALRSLRKQPLFTFVAAMSLAVGIGANTAVFSVANALLLRPLPGVSNYEQVVELGRTRDASGFDTFAYPDFLDIREGVPALDRLAAYSIQVFGVSRGEEGVRAMGLIVSPEYFSVLGSSPQLGRYFTAEEDSGVGEHPVTVVSHAFWTGRLGSDADIIGSDLLINRIPHTVIGVAPAGFGGHIIGMPPEVYVPMTQASLLQDAPNLFEQRGSSWHMAVGLLAEDATLAQLNRQLNGIAERLATTYPDTNGRRGFVAQPLGPVPGGGRGPVRLFLLSLLGMAGVILLVTCANVAGMFVARGLSRGREMAVRVAIGAGRGALVQQLTIETLLVFLLGGLGGAVLGRAAVGLLRPDVLPTPVPITLSFAPDPVVWIFTAVITLTAGLVFGLFPALRATGLDAAPALRGERSRGGQSAGRLRLLFAGGQVAASLVLLVVAGLFVRSLQRAASIDTGFEPAGAYVTAVDLSLEGVADPSEGRLFQARILEALRGHGWVTSASLSGDLPLDMERSGTIAVPEGWDAAADRPGVGVDFNEVSDGYFETLGISVLAGRPITASDRAESRAVAVVSQSFADEAWPGEEAVGRSIRFGSTRPEAPVLEVVGVVDDVKNQMVTDVSSPFVYVPLAQRYSADVRVVVRTPLEPNEAIRNLRSAIVSLDPNMSRGPISSLEQYTSLGVLPQRVAAWVTTSLAALALLLSGLGVYGVISFSIGRQVREIGIRMALGADRRSVAFGYVRGAVLLALPGLFIGGALAVAVATAMRSLLLDLSPYDPATLLGVGALLMTVVTLAAWIPARRAARVDPSTSLREE